MSLTLYSLGLGYIYDFISKSTTWKGRKVSKGIKEGMVRKVEDEPVNSSVTNYAPEESFGEKSKI